MIVEPIFDPMDEPKYLFSQIAAAAEVPVNTARSWFFRGHLTLGEKDIDTEAKGLPRFLTPRTALVLAIMVRGVAAGMLPAAAAAAARQFTDIGHGASPTHAGRIPGRLFPDGETVLVIPRGTKANMKPRVVNLLDADGWRKVYVSSGTGHDTVVTLIRLSELVQSVLARLGVRAAVE